MLSVLRHACEDRTADIRHLRNGQVLWTGIDVLTATINRIGRKMSCVITGVSLLSVVPVVFGGMGWCAASDWPERAAREPAPVASSPPPPEV